MAKTKLLENIVGGYENSNVHKVCRAETTNFYQESTSPQASTSKILRSICGTSVYAEMPEAGCRGLYRVSRGPNNVPCLYGVWGSHLYCIQDINRRAVVSEIGRVSNASVEPVAMCETSGYGSAHPHLVIADGANVFAVDITLPISIQTEDYKALALPLRPGSTQEDPVYIKPTHLAYAYGYLLVLDADTDAFYKSYQYPFETTDSHGNIDYDIFQTAKFNGYGWVTYSEWKPDNTVALVAAGSFVYTFGHRSYQVFSYADDVNFPFQSPNTGGSEIGILAPRSLAVVGSQVFWLGASDIGQYGVYTMAGAQYARISTPDIEREIGSLSNPVDAVAQTWQEFGHVFYAITFRAASKTFVYDLTEKLWHVRATYDTSKPNCEAAWRPQYATLAYDKLMFGTLDDNKLIFEDFDKWEEYDGTPIRRRRRGGVVSSEWGPWYCDALKLIINCGQTADPNLDPKISMKYSWDGGTTWSNQWIGSVGQSGMYNWLVQWDNMGMGDELTVEISSTDPWPMALIAAKIQGDATAIL